MERFRSIDIVVDSEARFVECNLLRLVLGGCATELIIYSRSCYSIEKNNKMFLLIIVNHHLSLSPPTSDTHLLQSSRGLLGKNRKIFRFHAVVQLFFAMK